jgi:hypothetical protein
MQTQTKGSKRRDTPGSTQLWTKKNDDSAVLPSRCYHALQRRAIENNAKAKRRIVTPMVASIRSHKVKMVVMANNLDEYGVITITGNFDYLTRVRFLEFSKRGLGKPSEDHIKIAVAGIQNASEPTSNSKSYPLILKALSTGNNLSLIF